ncbi:MAG: hypothetical protein HYU99_10460 [Deltaproteobacteria bacterium]|nr:hypothetical protein [Deltaproteobacteria bacterium]
MGPVQAFLEAEVAKNSANENNHADNKQAEERVFLPRLGNGGANDGKATRGEE